MHYLHGIFDRLTWASTLGTINITTIFIICVIFIGKMDAYTIEIATIGPVVKMVLIDGKEWYISIGSSLICFYTHILV